MLASKSGSEQLQAINDYYAQLIENYFGPHIKAGAFRRLPRECFASLVIGPVHDYARRWLNAQVTGDITDYIDVFATAAWNTVRNTSKL